ncbi:MAG: hypothetical protein Q4B64_12115 [Spirochaetales bacterium]|nr:hypothetical protein [Spirochaetales bacterium]
MSVIAVTTVLLVIFNILMWLILLHKFNKAFSTKEIIEGTRDAINEKIREANNATDRDLKLIDSKIQELNRVKAEADRRLAVLRRELDTQQREREFRAAVESTGPKHHKKTASPYGASRNEPIQGEFTFTEKARVELGIPENAYPQGSAGVKAPEMEAEKQENLQEIPILNTVVYRTEDQIVPKKDFFQLVREYHMAGLPPEEIARITSRSAQEVRLVIQML